MFDADLTVILISIYIEGNLVLMERKMLEELSS
jgi:hypothetical protein